MDRVRLSLQNQIQFLPRWEGQHGGQSVDYSLVAAGKQTVAEMESAAD